MVRIVEATHSPNLCTTPVLQSKSENDVYRHKFPVSPFKATRFTVSELNQAQDVVSVSDRIIIQQIDL